MANKFDPNLRKAITALVKDTVNSFGTSIGDRFYFDNAPENVSLPYCVARINNAQPSRDSNTDFRRPRLELNIWQGRDNPSKLVFLIASELQDLFDNRQLTFDDYHHIGVMDFVNAIPLDFEENNSRYFVEYTIEMQEK